MTCTNNVVVIWINVVSDVSFHSLESACTQSSFILWSLAHNCSYGYHGTMGHAEFAFIWVKYSYFGWFLPTPSLVQCIGITTGGGVAAATDWVGKDVSVSFAPNSVGDDGVPHVV